jgi:hypothetical protein
MFFMIFFLNIGKGTIIHRLMGVLLGGVGGNHGLPSQKIKKIMYLLVYIYIYIFFSKKLGLFCLLSPSIYIFF